MHPMRDEATLPIQLAGQNAVNAHSYSRLLALYCKMPRFSAREHKQRWECTEKPWSCEEYWSQIWRRDTPALTQAWNHWQDSAFFRLWRARLGSLCLPCELYAQAQARVTMSDGWSGTEAAALPFGVWELSDMESMLQLRSDHALAIFVPAEHDNM